MSSRTCRGPRRPRAMRGGVVALPAAAVVVALVVMLSSCGGGGAVRDDGPLRAGGDPGSLCLPRRGPSTPVTLGLETLRNTGPERVRLLGVRLVGARHVALRGSYVVPVPDHQLVGGWSRWPPPPRVLAAAGVPRVRWRRLPGAVVTPGSGGLGLVIHARTTAVEPAGFRAVAIRYAVGSRAYVAVTSTRVVVRARC